MDDFSILCTKQIVTNAYEGKYEFLGATCTTIKRPSYHTKYKQVAGTHIRIVHGGEVPTESLCGTLHLSKGYPTDMFRFSDKESGCNEINLPLEREYYTSSMLDYINSYFATLLPFYAEPPVVWAIHGATMQVIVFISKSFAAQQPEGIHAEYLHRQVINLVATVLDTNNRMITSSIFTAQSFKSIELEDYSQYSDAIGSLMHADLLDESVEYTEYEPSELKFGEDRHIHVQRVTGISGYHPSIIASVKKNTPVQRKTAPSVGAIIIGLTLKTQIDAALALCRVRTDAGTGGRTLHLVRNQMIRRVASYIQEQNGPDCKVLVIENLANVMWRDVKLADVIVADCELICLSVDDMMRKFLLHYTAPGAPPIPPAQQSAKCRTTCKYLSKALKRIGQPFNEKTEYFFISKEDSTKDRQYIWDIFSDSDLKSPMLMFVPYTDIFLHVQANSIWTLSTLYNEFWTKKLHVLLHLSSLLTIKTASNILRSIASSMSIVQSEVDKIAESILNRNVKILPFIGQTTATIVRDSDKVVLEDLQPFETLFSDLNTVLQGTLFVESIYVYKESNGYFRFCHNDDDESYITGHAAPVEWLRRHILLNSTTPHLIDNFDTIAIEMHSSASSCPICMSRQANVILACGHYACNKCVAKCVTSGTDKCFVCSNGQAFSNLYCTVWNKEVTVTWTDCMPLTFPASESLMSFDVPKQWIRSRYIQSLMDPFSACMLVIATHSALPILSWFKSSLSHEHSMAIDSLKSSHIKRGHILPVLSSSLISGWLTMDSDVRHVHILMPIYSENMSKSETDSIINTYYTHIKNMDRSFKDAKLTFFVL